MSPADLSGIAVGLALFAAIVAVVGVVRRKGAQHRPGLGEPDAVSDEVVARLLDELRKARAEADYWQTQAQRLQRELDARGSSEAAEPPTT